MGRWMHLMAAPALVFALGLGLVGCGARHQPAPGDPWENVNRGTFEVNDWIDVHALEPVAKGWDFVVPDPFQRGLTNFFTNLGTPVVAVNNLLQGKPLPALSDLGRFGVNTIVGLGFIDPAGDWGLQKHDEDFGQTLAVWGIPGGPYVVIPLLGPSTPRDITGMVVDSALSVTPFFVDGFILTSARVVSAVNARARVLDQVREVKNASVDYYSAVRNGWTQRRDALIADSNSETVRPDQGDLYYPDEQDLK